MNSSSLRSRAVWSWAAAAVAWAAAWPSVGTGFFCDDFVQLAMREGLFGRRLPAWDLYRFVPSGADRVRAYVQEGALPWWTVPELRLHFFRPIPSSLFSLEHALWGRSAWPYHLHSLLWLGVLLVVLRALFVRCLGEKTGALALLVVGLGPGLSQPSKWIAARPLLLAAVAVALGLWFRTRDDGRRSKVLAALAFGSALFQGEAGLGGLAFWAAYESLGPGDRRWPQRLRACAWPVVLGLVYLAAYKWAGFGAHESDGYVEPLSSPATFAEVSALRVPALVANGLLAAPAEFAQLVPGVMAALGYAGAGLLALVTWRWWPSIEERHRATLRWALPGALLATIGAGGGFPGGRELVVAGLGYAAFVAVLITTGFRARPGASKPRRVGRYAVAVLLTVLHGVFSPLFVQATRLDPVARAAERLADEIAVVGRGARRVVLLNGSDPMLWLYADAILAVRHAPPLDCWSAVAPSKRDQVVRQLDEHTLSIVSKDGALLQGPFERLFRPSRRPLPEGTEVRQCGVRIRVTESVADGPVSLDVRFDEPISDPSTAVLVFRGGHVERFQARGGAAHEEMTLPWSPGPFGLF